MCQENLQKVQVYVPIRRSLYWDELRNLPFFVGLASNIGKRNLVASLAKPHRWRLQNIAYNLQQYSPHHRVNLKSRGATGLLRGESCNNHLMLHYSSRYWVPVILIGQLETYSQQSQRQSCASCPLVSKQIWGALLELPRSLLLANLELDRLKSARSWQRLRAPRVCSCEVYGRLRRHTELLRLHQTELNGSVLCFDRAQHLNHLRRYRRVPRRASDFH